MAISTWTQRFETGIPSIDAQHRKLVDMLNSLFDAMTQGKGQTVINDILKEMIKYTATHFNDEEKLMQRCGFPGFMEHHKEHEKLREQACKLYDDLVAGKAQVTSQTAMFLKDWLKNHILDTDMKYVEHLKAKGAK